MPEQDPTADKLIDLTARLIARAHLRRHLLTRQVTEEPESLSDDGDTSSKYTNSEGEKQ